LESHPGLTDHVDDLLSLARCALIVVSCPG
jgi:hypothetical protein